MSSAKQFVPKLAFVLLVAAVLAGCSREIVDRVDTFLGAASPEFNPPKQPPTYCYRTLGETNCYRRPLPGTEANRLVGYDGPAPRATSGTGPLSP